MEKGWDKTSKNYTDAGYSVIKGEILSDLVSEGVLGKNSSLIDIGCGPGFFSVLLSGHVGRVYAMDSSEGMLKCLSETVSEKGIANITPLRADWDTFSPERTYNTVFTSLCPPTNNPESILKMNSLSDGNCVYVSSMGNDDSPHVKIWHRLGCDYSFKGYNTQYPFEYLKSLGADVRLKTYSQHVDKTMSYEEAFEAEIRRITGYRERTEEIEEAVAYVLDGMKEGDEIRYSADMKLGMLVWNRFQTDRMFGSGISPTEL